MKKPVFTTEGCPPWFNRLRRGLENDNSTYLQPLQSTNRLIRQQPGLYDEDRLQTKNYARYLITLLSMGKDLLQKTRIAFFGDSTMKSSYNANNTLMDVRVMNVPCTSLSSEMAEVTDKIFTPVAAETIPLSSILVYSNVIDHLVLQGTLKYFESGHVRFTEAFVTDEVTANLETMSNITRTMRNQSPPRELYRPQATYIFPGQYDSSCT